MLVDPAEGQPEGAVKVSWREVKMDIVENEVAWAPTLSYGPLK